MRIGHVVVMVAVVAAVGSGCGASTAATREDPTPSAVTGTALPCADAEQSRVDLDVPGPGQPSPEEAVATYAGALELASREVNGDTVVVGLRQDGSIFRTYHVSQRADGWWPDGYSECRA
ncbi:hypothetical protein GCM10009641_30700 [Mycobacterium cookii]|uniref:Uncharacterized protein n=1 Tax=Nocardioides furvisabuli TaxID=375542 RepID=A0ABN2XNF5_9ACTN|nr:hypothetical protein [Nocardioides furvisabuli]